jgi:hypothetical protein
MAKNVLLSTAKEQMHTAERAGPAGSLLARRRDALSRYDKQDLVDMVLGGRYDMPLLRACWKRLSDKGVQEVIAEASRDYTELLLKAYGEKETKDG